MGGQRKAVIFTESRRTQVYLYELLSRNGYAGQIVFLNGVNNDPDSKRIYDGWKERHKDDGSVSGSRQADMKAAVVEEFRDRACILIGTEAAAEGINLQFCSLLVNYACQGIDAGMNRLSELDVSQNGELVELYINDNRLTAIDLSGCPKLKYFYCHNNGIEALDTQANPLLRHLNATGNPMKRILSLAPQRDEPLPLELTAGEGGCVGLKYNPVYNAQWKETGGWQQTYYAYPEDGKRFVGWFDPEGHLLSMEEAWLDTYGTSRVMSARFE